MTPSYDVVPGDRVGPLKLGDTLWSVLELLRTEQTAYPRVEVSWDESQPHTSPIVIHLPHLTLYFPPFQTQSLGEITVSDLATTPLTLKYDAHILCSPAIDGAPQTLLTRGLVGRVLGPTYDSKGSAELVYPGIAFHVGGKRGVSGGRDEVMDRVVVSPKDDTAVAREGGLTACIISPGRGVKLSFGLDPPIEVILGQTTSQDLLLDLGPPLRRYWKEDERLEKMWAGKNGKEDLDANGGECFFNYFQYGLDFLVSSGGIVTKIIAHSNIPASPLFQRYAKCPWTISSPSAPLSSESPISAFHAAFSAANSIPTIIAPDPSPPADHLAIPSSSTGKKKKRSVSANSASSDRSTSDTPEPGMDKGKGVDKATGEVQGMTLDRIGEGGLEGVKGEMRSRLVGFEGLVVEEDLASGGVASVLIYRANG